MTCCVSVRKSDCIVTSKSNGRKSWQLLSYSFPSWLCFFLLSLIYIKVPNSWCFCAHKKWHKSIVMTRGHVFLAEDLQHRTWSIFFLHCTQKNPQIAWFCALLITDLALMVSLFAFWLYGTFLFLHCPFTTYFQILWFHTLTDLSWIFQYCRTRPSILTHKDVLVELCRYCWTFIFESVLDLFWGVVFLRFWLLQGGFLGKIQSTFCKIPTSLQWILFSCFRTFWCLQPHVGTKLKGFY